MSPDPGGDPAAALDRHRAALHAIAGVVATGLGRRRGDDALCVQIFVAGDEHVATVTSTVIIVLGGDVPFDVVVTGPATAGGEPD